jgi:hypothetical protein
LGKVSHTGLKVGLRRFLHSLYLDSGSKYDRFMAIAYLPRRGRLDPCVAIGSLEVSKDDPGKEFYNPMKFSSPGKLFEAMTHILATYIAYAARHRGLTVREVFVPILERLRHDYRLHDKLVRLAEGYYRSMALADAVGPVGGLDGPLGGEEEADEDQVDA